MSVTSSGRSSTRMVVGDRLGHVLQQHGLTRARRRDDQCALAFALRADQVDHASRLVLDRRVERVEPQALVGIKRGQVVEVDAVTNSVRIVEIDLDQAVDRKIALAIFRCANFAFNRITRTQAPFPDLVRRDINVIGTSKIIRFRTTQKAEPVGQHFDRSDAENFFAVFSHFLQNGEHQILAAQRARALDAQLFGHRNEIGRGFFL